MIDEDEEEGGAAAADADSDGGCDDVVKDEEDVGTAACRRDEDDKGGGAPRAHDVEGCTGVFAPEPPSGRTPVAHWSVDDTEVLAAGGAWGSDGQ